MVSSVELWIRDKSSALPLTHQSTLEATSTAWKCFLTSNTRVAESVIYIRDSSVIMSLSLYPDPRAN